MTMQEFNELPDPIAAVFAEFMESIEPDPATAMLMVIHTRTCNECRNKLEEAFDDFIADCVMIEHVNADTDKRSRNARLN